MRIAMIGTGYVGLVSGVCFSDFGHDVICVDKDPSKIEMLERGEVPIYEPGLDVLMAKNVEAGRLSFTGDLKEAVAGADAVFIAVGTVRILSSMWHPTQNSYAKGPPLMTSCVLTVLWWVSNLIVQLK